jgi:hypothetical protein
MKATIEFHDEQELRDAIDGWKWKSAMWKLDQEMRSIIKHGNFGSKEATDEQIQMTEYWRQMLRELVSDNGLDIES